MPIESTPHLIVPFARCSGDDWQQAMASLELKALSKLMRGMSLVEIDSGLANSLSPPHERVQAKAWGMTASRLEGKPKIGVASHGIIASPDPRPLPMGEGVIQDGLIPWAAFEARAKPNEGWAFIAPCHWAMGREHATLTDPETLELSEADSRTLLAAMQPYFATEGITLDFMEPTRWLAKGDVFRSLPTASLDRVLGRNVDRWLPATAAMKLLQNEMQMLLYTHPVNDERAAKGQRSVNSFWVSGSGALMEPANDHSHVNITRILAQSAFANDWTAYAQTWARLDANNIAHLLTRQNSGDTMRISLCGESNAMTFQTVPRGIFGKLKSVISPQRPIDVLKQL